MAHYECQHCGAGNGVCYGTCENCTPPDATRDMIRRANLPRIRVGVNGTTRVLPHNLPLRYFVGSRHGKSLGEGR